MMDIPYRAKFSRRIIFAFFADCHRTSKIKLREILETVLHVGARMLTASLVRENCFGEISENANPRKLCTSKIWRYTVVTVTMDAQPQAMTSAHAHNLIL